jgi:HD-GYP domain-containing protein (c-di-GMP phosphodiesterase class II)
MIRRIDFHDFIMTLTSTLDAKDAYTCGHSLRVADFSCVIAQGLAPKALHNVHFAAHLHDIGKIGIKDCILLKPGKLTDQEFKEMERHSIKGYEILSNSEPLRRIAIIVRHHHERYDGRGYPDGLKKREIPLGSRIIAVADALDAMTSPRPYRQPMPFNEAIIEINLHSGDQFDPHAVEIVNRKKEQLLKIISTHKREIMPPAKVVAHGQLRHSRGK